MNTATAFETPARYSTDTMATRAVQTLAAPISGISPMAREKSARSVSLQLTRGEVHRIDRVDGFQEIHVLDGVLWLTTTPAAGDVQLRAANRFSLPEAWPIVFEAVKDASVLLVRRPDRCV